MEGELISVPIVVVPLLQLWATPIVSAASDRNSTLSGPTGVKMSGPYSWVPPNYVRVWLRKDFRRALIAHCLATLRSGSG
jgi:hypothetical protein